MGLEPTRAYTHKILSLACLPIPALPLTAFYFCLSSESLTDEAYYSTGAPRMQAFFCFFYFFLFVLIIPIFL